MFYGHVSGLPQYEATKAYMPKDPDELGLQQAELVIVLRKEEGEAVSEFGCALVNLWKLGRGFLYSPTVKIYPL